jgi:hypothetical protein
LGTQFSTSDLKNAQELNAQVTEEDKRRLDLERLAKDGMLNLLTSIAELLLNIQELAFGVMFAETQIMLRLFGVILLIQRRDGNTVIQLVSNQLQFNQSRLNHQSSETDAEHWKGCSAMVKTIEVISKRPRLEKNAKCGHLNLLKSTPEHHRNFQKLASLLTSAETQMVTRLFGAIPLIQRRDGKNVLQGRLVLQLRLHSNQSSQ